MEAGKNSCDVYMDLAEQIIGISDHICHGELAVIYEDEDNERIQGNV